MATALTPTAHMQAQKRAYEALPYPLVLVVPVRDERVQDQLDRQHAKQERRRFTGEPITAMGDLT